MSGLSLCASVLISLAVVARAMPAELCAAPQHPGEACVEAATRSSNEGSNPSQAIAGVFPRSICAERLTIAPVHLPSGAPTPAGLLPGLLVRPRGWLHGAGVVVLTWDGRDPIAGRDRLVSGLLDDGFSVLELDLATPRGFSVDSDRTPPDPTVEEFVADLGAVALALQRDHGAGVVAALGYGEGGEAALQAAARGGLSVGARLSPHGSVATAGEDGQPDRRAMAARLCAVITAAAPEYWPATACAVRQHCSCTVVP